MIRSVAFACIGALCSCAIPEEFVIAPDSVLVVASEVRLYAFRPAPSPERLEVLWARELDSLGAVRSDLELEGSVIDRLIVPADDYCPPSRFPTIRWETTFWLDTAARELAACAERQERATAPCSVTCGVTVWSILPGS
jgi:hypothetical protein